MNDNLDYAYNCINGKNTKEKLAFKGKKHLMQFGGNVASESL